MKKPIIITVFIVIIIIAFSIFFNSNINRRGMSFHDFALSFIGVNNADDQSLGGLPINNSGGSTDSSIYVSIGKGCTTAFYIDEDCDGYVIGGKNGNLNMFPNFPAISISVLGADANDNDVEVNTTESVTLKYGDLSNINNLKAYLRGLGYTHNIHNVYFVSLNGDNSTAEVNNINRPYISAPEGVYGDGPSIIGPGDVIVYREGVWPAGSLSTRGYQSASGGTHDVGYQGNASQPILLINFPGERVIFKGTSGGSVFSTSQDTKYTILDGFEFDGSDSSGTIVSNEIFRLTTRGDHITFRRLELRNAGRWGIFGATITDRDYFTFDKVVVHHIDSEHCLYRNDAISGLDTDIGWVIKNSNFYACGGHNIHWRGGKDFIFENDIFSNSGWNGIEIKDSPENGIIRNNLIFNNGKAPFVIYEDTDAQRNEALGTNNILVTQNTFVAKSGYNGVGSDESAFPAVSLAHSEGAHSNGIKIHRNVRFFNNIFYTTNNVAFWFDYAPDIAEMTIENNIFYRLGASAPDDSAGMAVCGFTDNTHNAVAGCAQFQNLYIWNFASMHNAVLRPKIRNNILANPLFTDAQSIYTIQFNSGLFNFFPTVNSPSIDFGLPQYATSFDLRGNVRANTPDAGAYEYSTGGGPIIGPTGNNGGTSISVTPKSSVRTDVGNTSTNVDNGRGRNTTTIGSRKRTPTIAELEAQILTLRATLLALLQQRSLATGFTRDLTLGSTGPDVLSLQRYLNNNGFVITQYGPGSPGLETVYFGNLTRAALASFQRSKGIIPAVGYFGPITRGLFR